MTTTMTTFATFCRQASLVLALALTGLAGCGMEPTDEELDSVAESDDQSQALARGGGGQRLGYSCTNGTCTCSKSIENDCEDMSAVCTDATVDGLINCINGWLTTHCTCTKAFRAPSPSPYTVPTTSTTFVKTTR